MAVIEPRTSQSGATSWRVKIRIKGNPQVSASFKRRTDAKQWAAKTESEILEDKYFKHARSKRLTLSTVIQIYCDEGLSHLKDPHTRVTHLAYWEKKLGATYLAELTANRVLECRTELAADRSNSTANRYVASLSALLSYAAKERQLLANNPLQNIKKLKEPKGRTRILSERERINLIKSCETLKKYPEMIPIVLLAITTGMRRGEILNLRWADIDFRRQKIVIWNTKNDETRHVPLVGPALRAVREWSKIRPINDSALLFPSQVKGNPQNIFHLDHAWRLVKSSTGLTDFRFHDLRHTAASYLAMNGAGLREIADILGHKTLAMVMRYSHLTEDHKHQTVTRMSNAIFGESA
jgi:integrase